MSSPKITILMPAYNAASYIEEAITSVLQQSFSDFELLIINDGSTDDTEIIIMKFSDDRIRLIKLEHAGIVPALNKGLEVANSAYIARFDADDICLPGRLEKQYNFLETNRDYIICAGEAEYITSAGEHLFNFECSGYTHEKISASMQMHCPFIHSAVMYRKEVVLKAGGYSLYAHSFEDHLLWLNLSAYGRFANLAEQLIKVRFNPSSVTIDEKWRGSEFRNLKRKILMQGHASETEGRRLKEILKSQDNRKIKEASYHALCGKKFLINNYQPQKARKKFRNAIRLQPLRLDNYALFIISFFPRPFVHFCIKN